MGVIIYKSGELKINGHKDEEGLKKFLAEAELVKDGWEENAFFIDAPTIEFVCDEHEGCCSPFEDAVEKPLMDILKLAKKYGVQLDGSFVINSSCSDYDNITIRVCDSKDTYHNTQVLNAPDEDLIAELESRGYKISMDDKTN